VKRKLNGVAALGIQVLALSPCIASAQPAPFPARTVPFSTDTGRFRGAIGPETESFTASRQTVRIPGAHWLRLRFGDHNLGAESYVTITSLKNGEQQRLDAESLRLWQNQTAMFSGDAVAVELHVAPGEDGIFFRIEEVIAGEAVSGSGSDGGAETAGEGPGTEAICGTTDDRVASAHRAVGRTATGGCTAWIVSNGAFLTAGHCTPGAMPSVNLTEVHFNIPPSAVNGAINPPPLADQYPVIAGSIVFSDDGVGDDWAIFNVGVDAANDGVDRLPVHAQGAFFRMSRDNSPGTVRLTGHGLDGPPDCFGDPPRQPGCIPPLPPSPVQNADSQTQQTHTGRNQGESGSGANVRFEYTVDSQRGNSGSPIIVDSTDLTVGLHTNAGCSTGGANRGTSFENDDLETALRNFSGVGANVRHLDNGHPIAPGLQDGTVFRPFDTLTEAVDSVPAGGVVSIVAGEYRGREITTISKPMTLRAPVGPVTLTSTSPSLTPGSCSAGQKCCEPAPDGLCFACVPSTANCE
jgi:hypothetical protein